MDGIYGQKIQWRTRMNKMKPQLQQQNRDEQYERTRIH